MPTHNPASSCRSLLRRAAASLALAFTLAPALLQAQNTDPLNTSPRGLTEEPAPFRPGSALTGAIRQTGAAVPAAVPARSAAPQAAPAAAPLTAPPLSPLSPLPPDPALAGKPLVFGSQIFSGRFGNQAFSGFNPDHQIAVGDRVNVRMWGAYTFEMTQPVDAQGNIFLPNVGPVRVLGVRNVDLNREVETQIKRIFRSNVGTYATLEAAQPVKVYVTGFVRAPGLYSGLSSDSVLAYLDRAGGIDPDRGSYLEVQVLRNGKPRAQVGLYRFLLDGKIEPLQLQDGDTVVVAPRQYTALINGEVLNPFIFEFAKPVVSADELLAIARPRPGATHMSIVRKRGAERRSEYHPLSAAAQISIEDGDEVTLTSDKATGTILVRVEGAHLGERTLVMPYGSRLAEALGRIKPAPQARMEAVQLFRRSVALRQKELLENSLRSLETYALTSRSATSEEASLRVREGQQILDFIDRARQLQPRGQVILAGGTAAGETLMEDGDVIRVPEISSVVQVSGEVLLPNALAYDSAATLETYVQRAGGYTQGADKAQVMVVRQDGSVAESAAAALRPGDEIMVLPKIEAKNIEITRGITQIIYQMAVAAKVIFGL